MEVWEGLPGFQWYAPVLRAKAGSDVLCVHKDVSNEFGRISPAGDADLRRGQSPLYGD